MPAPFHAITETDMIRSAIACLVLLTSAVTLPAQEKAVNPNPTIAWYGNSFFVVKSSKGPAVAFDPHMIPAFGRAEGAKADIVLLSHLHNDHTNVFALDNARDKAIRIIPGLTQAGKAINWNTVDETIKGIRVRSIPAYHDAAEGMTRGKNTIFVIDVDGWRICHLGDLGHELTDAQLKKIGEVDVLMVPVGGIYTLNGAEAKRVVAQIKPKEYILPMHYGLPFFDELLPIDEFLEEQEKARIAVATDNQITLNRDPQRPRPLIVQLNHSPKK